MNDAAPPHGKGRILVVDDDRLVLATVTHGLAQAGYEVIDADNGDDAILLARQHRPALALLDILIVVWIGPNVLRSFCLHFVSSNMHYHGDVTPGDVIQQTQVLNPWWLLPFQAFCFNFGSTHAIHHFVVKEPFYIRQWTAPTAHRVMREMGVRFNDFGTFVRANRWSDPKRSAQSAA